MIIATAGHIDHGKSSLVKAITGINTDRLPEEKKRGMSIDLGFAYQELENGTTLGFVDVPGHEKFVRNMLAGVTGIDYAMLIVAADDGPMPQTIEHLSILDLLGVSEGIVALTKIDRVDDDRLRMVEDEVNDILEGTCLKGSDIFRVSTPHGQGIDEVRNHLETMSDLLGDRSINGNFRLAIDRSFTVPGAGVIVTGSVFSGKVAIGDNLVLSPQGTHVRVRGIHAQNKESDVGFIGQRCAINITGGQLNKDDIHRGAWLLPKGVHRPIPRFDARISVLSNESKPLAHWTPVHVHLGAVEVPGRVAILGQKFINPGESGLVQIVLDRLIGALKGDGFIIRDQSAKRTLAGGRVIDPFSSARGRAKPERLAILNALDNDSIIDALLTLTKLLPSGLNFSSFIQSWNLTPDESMAVETSIELITIKTDDIITVFSPNHFDKISVSILNILRDWHEDNPEKPGPSSDILRKLLSIRLAKGIFKEILKVLVSDEKIIYSGSSFSLPGFENKLNGKDEILWKKIKPLLEKDKFQPPVVHALSDDLKMDPRIIQKFLVQIAKLNLVCQVAKNRFLLPYALKDLAEIIDLIGSKNASFGVREFRDKSGIGRNLAIEILEFFDRSGFTWRTGDTRKIVKPSSEIFGDIQ
ncbi:MAG: selenocysteine-specific translation elongation factor [Rhodospirillaceae bacterium]|nr:selenocysteine-specific translation elongation factor [Rhodospirillaceae bacterium]